MCIAMWQVVKAEAAAAVVTCDGEGHTLHTVSPAVVVGGGVSS